MSLPTWERGLKLTGKNLIIVTEESLPTWERGLKRLRGGNEGGTAPVAPHVGAWIETKPKRITIWHGTSLPTWERGLKRNGEVYFRMKQHVAPHVGAWIETLKAKMKDGQACRSPRGSVD